MPRIGPNDHIAKPARRQALTERDLAKPAAKASESDAEADKPKPAKKTRKASKADDA